MGQASFLPAPQIGIKNNANSKTLINWAPTALEINDKNGNRLISSVYSNPFFKYTNFYADGNVIMQYREDGRVIIGSSPFTLTRVAGNGANIVAGDYKLFVENGILTEKCKVAVKSTNFWSDYVFEEDYEMMDIEELEDYVSENKHLPNVPSAEEVVENGIDVATMDAKLLEKIEEAYLYIINLNKKVDALAIENESLKTSLQSISTSGK